MRGDGVMKGKHKINYDNWLMSMAKWGKIVKWLEDGKPIRTCRTMDSECGYCREFLCSDCPLRAERLCDNYCTLTTEHFPYWILAVPEGHSHEAQLEAARKIRDFIKQDEPEKEATDDEG